MTLRDLHGVIINWSLWTSLDVQKDYRIYHTNVADALAKWAEEEVAYVNTSSYPNEVGFYIRKEREDEIF